MQPTPRYGVIGLGLMGAPIAQRLLSANLPVTLYNRSPEKAKPLADQGATIATSPTDLLRQTDIIILMLTDAQASRDMVLGDPAELNGKTIVQMSTIAPEESRDLQSRITAAGAQYLEAPVLGSIPEAKAGTLILMVGASPEQFAEVEPMLRLLGPEPMLIGPVGVAMALKLAMNQLIASLTQAFALSLGYSERQGVPIESLMAILRSSALYAPTFDKKLDRMVNRNYANPNFPAKHLAKDVALFAESAQPLGIDISGLLGVSDILKKTLEIGLGEGDYSALFSAVNPDSSRAMDRQTPLSLPAS
jgi:3-hydroxyisobutyrate dehydrogenase